MKYMILMYGSQQDYDAMAGSADRRAGLVRRADFAAMGAFMEAFGTRTWPSPGSWSTRRA